MNADKILEHMLNGTQYEYENLWVYYGTLYLRGVPIIILRTDKVEFCPAASLPLQRAMFDLMKQQGVIAKKAKFPTIEVLSTTGYSIPIARCKTHEPEPMTVPVCDDTRELL